jgi:hypothetical protein
MFMALVALMKSLKKYANWYELTPQVGFKHLSTPSNVTKNALLVLQVNRLNTDQK